MNISEFIEEHFEEEQGRINRKRSFSSLHEGARLVQITGQGIDNNIIITPLSDRGSHSPERFRYSRNSLSKAD